MKLLLSNSILSVASNRIRIHALELCVIPGYELDTLQHHCLIRNILVSQFELAYMCLVGSSRVVQLYRMMVTLILDVNAI
ncbi:hypothetical protein POPTR_004G088550v4 [Populus trichocarpa]|uniref:Uncharacterized protein n=1 Tax=Populus trichocarpa TaxID=3694 RepID=A0ACC0T4J8_POPTR|nr:hypothetical protein BDE02_04G075800 [Populus trichocarpa]KAI9396169.1 hypothetical protein POPTR_004G088550v4 [Populus trichocarpa]